MLLTLVITISIVSLPNINLAQDDNSNVPEFTDVAKEGNSTVPEITDVAKEGNSTDTTTASEVTTRSNTPDATDAFTTPQVITSSLRGSTRKVDLGSDLENQPTNVLPAEHKLYMHLFGGLNSKHLKHVRPVRNYQSQLVVRYGICLMSIDDIVEKDQAMISTGCVKMKWTDELLTWDPEEYDNLTWIIIPSDKIWIPDIAMVNSPHPFAMTKKPANVELSFTGEVGYYPTGRFQTRCPVTLSYFPFDEQLCEYQFESWAYPTRQLEMVLWPDGPVDLKGYVTNHQWRLNGISVQNFKLDYDGLYFSGVKFQFFFKRRSLYYAVYAIYPGFLMALLQLFSLTLPLEHPGRMGLLTSLFIGNSVLQGYIANSMPKSSEGVSLVQIYLMMYSSTLVISIIQTAINMHIFYRTPEHSNPGIVPLIKSYFINFGIRPEKKADKPTPALASPTSEASPGEEETKLMPSTQESEGSVLHNRRGDSSSPQKQEDQQPAKILSTPNSNVENWPPVGKRWAIGAPPGISSGLPVESKMAGPMGAASAAEQRANEAREAAEKAKAESEAAKVRARHRWLIFAAKYDRFSFYSMGLIHLVAPIYLFLISPTFQEYSTEASTENMQFIDT